MLELKAWTWTIAMGALVLAGVCAQATAMSDPPGTRTDKVVLGPTAQIAMLTSGQQVASVKPDPVEGGWVVLSAPDALIRIGEDGAVKSIPLPPALQGTQLAFTPLRDGWGLATARVFPGGRGEEEDCLSRIPFGRCGILMVAQLSPADRWTPAHPLPHSSGQDSSGFEVPAQAIASDDRIELVWCQECLGGGQPHWIAAARPGDRFGAARRVQRALHIDAEHESVETFRGRFYVRAQFGSHGELGEGGHIVEREIHANGHLGPPHFMHSPLIRLEGFDSGPYAGAGNSEEFVFGEGTGGRVGVAQRRGWGSKLGRPRYIAAYGGCCLQVAEAPDHRLLVVTEERTRKRWRSIAAEVTPNGHLEADQNVEDDPNSEGTISDSEAIDDAGQALVASIPPLETEPSPVWLHGADKRCRNFSRSPFMSSPNQLAETGTPPEVFAGTHDVFHLVWTEHGRLQTVTAHVGCAGT